MKKQPAQYGLEVERIRHLLALLFEGNQSRMARELGVAQPLISRVLSGDINPGKRLVTNLSAHPKVNPAWLSTGKGDPLLAEPEAADSAGWPIPIASCLLPGPPGENRIHLTPQVHYVPGVTYRETLYAIEAGTYLPEDLLALLRIFPGDLLLIETDETVWRENLDVLHGRLGVLRLQAGSSQRIVLNSLRVGNRKDPNAVLADSVDELRGRLFQDEEDRKCFEEHRKYPPGIQLREEATDPKKPNASKATENRVQLDEIIGLLVQLIRVFPRRITEEV